MEARTSPGAQIFHFRSIDKTPTRRRAIPWEISLRNVEGPESGARHELTMGNGSSFCCVFTGLFPEPLPIIGVRRAIMQSLAHDDDHYTAPPPRIHMHSKGRS
jgi:hypothetical protein